MRDGLVKATTDWALTWALGIRIFRITLCSTFCPPLVKWNVNVGGGVLGSVLDALGCSVVPLTLTESSECPCVPGVGLPPGVES